MAEMLRVVGFPTLDALIDATVPANIRREVRIWPRGRAPALFRPLRSLVCTSP